MKKSDPFLSFVRTIFLDYDLNDCQTCKKGVGNEAKNGTLFLVRLRQKNETGPLVKTPQFLPYYHQNDYITSFELVILLEYWKIGPKL